MKLGWKKKSCILNLHNWNGSAQLRGGGRGLILKNKKNDVFLTYEGVIGSS